jgi:hypothetical protein
MIAYFRETSTELGISHPAVSANVPLGADFRLRCPGDPPRPHRRRPEPFGSAPLSAELLAGTL